MVNSTSTRRSDWPISGDNFLYVFVRLSRRRLRRRVPALAPHSVRSAPGGAGPDCSFCGTSTGPFSEIEGLFTVRICIPCLEVRQAQPDRMLGFHDPGQPWEQWGCPIDGCGRWFLGPWDLEGHTAAEHPGWTATYELLRPYPNQRQRVVYRRSAPPAS
jgi:hypothetical protein